VSGAVRFPLISTVRFARSPVSVTTSVVRYTTEKLIDQKFESITAGFLRPKKRGSLL
jgi:hypothetical protein